MIICNTCLEKGYLNQTAFTSIGKCEVCQETKETSDIAEERLLKKEIHDQINSNIPVEQLGENSSPTTSEVLPQQPSPSKKTRRPRTIKTDEIPEPEVSPVPETNLVDVIETTLIKHNITEAMLAEMEKNFLPLTINGINDKEGYEAVRKARIACKNTRILAVDLCKTGREKAIKEQKDWIAKEKEIVGKIKIVEDTLAEREDAIDNERARITQEAESKKQAILQERAVKLSGYGMMLLDNVYILDDIRISVLQVKESDDFTFTSLLAAVESKWKAKEEIRIADEERQRLLREEQLAKEAELKRKEEEIAAREQAIKDAEERIKREAELRDLAIKKAQEDAELARLSEINAKIRARETSLFQLGFAQQGDNFLFGPNKFSRDQIHAIDESEWPKALESIAKTVADEKARLEQERLAREEAIRAKAEADAKKRMEEEQEADRIAALEKAEAERAEALRIEALRPDIEKFNRFMQNMTAIPIPEFSTAEYIAFAETIKSDRIAMMKVLYSKKPA
jgi:hypothetical protein